MVEPINSATPKGATKGPVSVQDSLGTNVLNIWRCEVSHCFPAQQLHRMQWSTVQLWGRTIWLLVENISSSASPTNAESRFWRKSSCFASSSVRGLLAAVESEVASSAAQHWSRIYVNYKIIVVLQITNYMDDLLTMIHGSTISND